MLPKQMSHSGNIILMAFASMILMVGSLVYAATKQDVSMVSDNYYQEELVYQQKIDAIANADQLKASFAVMIKADSLVLQLPIQLSNKMTSGFVHIYCPFDEKKDRIEKLHSNANGLYAFSIAHIEGKSFIAKVSFIADGTDYYKEFKIN